jgi:hypothetical protein
LQSYALPCGPAGKCRRPRHRRGDSATDRASAIASVSSPRVTDWTDPCPARPTRPRGNAVSRYPAGRAPAVANPGSSCPKGRIAEVNRIRSPSLAASRSRIFTRDTSIGPIPVWTARSGRQPWCIKTTAAVGKLEVLHRFEKGLRLQFNCLRQRPSSSRSQDVCQWIVNVVWPAKRKTLLFSFMACRSLGEVLAGFDTRRDTPPSHSIMTHFPASLRSDL